MFLSVGSNKIQLQFTLDVVQGADLFGGINQSIGVLKDVQSRKRKGTFRRPIGWGISLRGSSSRPGAKEGTESWKPCR
jgi:hypothetical protein